jgi:hypothetical protein
MGHLRKYRGSQVTPQVTGCIQLVYIIIHVIINKLLSDFTHLLIFSLIQGRN